MLRKLVMVLLFMALVVAQAARAALAQNSVSFQEGVGGYSGTVDTEFRRANPDTPQGSSGFITVDDFDGGFPTQGAIRFESLFASEGGPIPDEGVTISEAELEIFVVNSSVPEANISFHRVLGPDTDKGDAWDDEDTWATLGGGTAPDPATGLFEFPIRLDDIEAQITPDDILSAPEAIEEHVALDVTDSVQAWLNGAPNLGWAIHNDTGNGWDFLSSEFESTDLPDFLERRPKLTVSYVEGEGAIDGDYNGNGQVEQADLNLVLLHWGDATPPVPDGWFHHLPTGAVDQAELNQVLLNWGNAAASGVLSPAAVPEPTSLVIAMLGLLALFPALVRRRQYVVC